MKAVIRLFYHSSLNRCISRENVNRFDSDDYGITAHDLLVQRILTSKRYRNLAGWDYRDGNNIQPFRELFDESHSIGVIRRDFQTKRLGAYYDLRKHFETLLNDIPELKTEQYRKIIKNLDIYICFMHDGIISVLIEKIINIDYGHSVDDVKLLTDEIILLVNYFENLNFNLPEPQISFKNRGKLQVGYKSNLILTLITVFLRDEKLFDFNFFTARRLADDNKKDKLERKRIRIKKRKVMRVLRIAKQQEEDNLKKDFLDPKKIKEKNSGLQDRIFIREEYKIPRQADDEGKNSKYYLLGLQNLVFDRDIFISIEGAAPEKVETLHSLIVNDLNNTVSVLSGKAKLDLRLPYPFRHKSTETYYNKNIFLLRGNGVNLISCTDGIVDTIPSILVFLLNSLTTLAKSYQLAQKDLDGITDKIANLSENIMDGNRITRIDEKMIKFFTEYMIGTYSLLPILHTGITYDFLLRDDELKEIYRSYIDKMHIYQMDSELKQTLTELNSTLQYLNDLKQQISTGAVTSLIALAAIIIALPSFFGDSFTTIFFNIGREGDAGKNFEGTPIINLFNKPFLQYVFGGLLIGAIGLILYTVLKKYLRRRRIRFLKSRLR